MKLFPHSRARDPLPPLPPRPERRKLPSVCEQFAALELRIEAAWLGLTTMRYNRPRTYYLSPTGLLVYDSRGGDVATAVEIGTFTRTEDLQHFREAVFFVWDEMHGGRNGG